MQDLPQCCEASDEKNQGAAGLRQLPENELGEYEMNCMICHLDKKKHSKELWKLHQQSKLCMFCSKSGSEHSEELWELHKSAAEKGQWCPLHKKREKLYPIAVGTARKGIARTCKTIVQDKPHGTILTLPDPPRDIDLVPIYMSCAECDLYLGSIEEDHADILGCMCLKCFRDATGQSGDWCDISPAFARPSHTEIVERHSKDTLISIPEEEKNG